MSAADRQRRYRARQGARTGQPGPPRKPIAHGEPRGAKQHRRRGETPCGECLQAEAAYRAARRRTSP